MDAGISSFMPQAPALVSFIVHKTVVLPSSDLELGCLGLLELKLLFPFVSSSGFIWCVGPQSTKGPPTTPEMGCSCQQST